MTCGRVKASARKRTSGAGLVDFGDAPLPEGQGLGVGVVDAEDADAAVDPELEDAVEGVPEAAPVGGLEVEGVDVLIFFGRIFGVLDGAVGTVVNQAGCSLTQGWSGRALEGDVEGELHAVVRGRLRRGSRSRRRCRARGGWRCGRLRREPMAQGLPTSPGSAVTELFLPLRKALPMGWMGGM